MIYSRNLDNSILNNSTNSSGYEHDDESLFKDPATYVIKDTDRFISVNGTILFRNTWGYLNAER